MGMRAVSKRVDKGTPTQHIFESRNVSLNFFKFFWENTCRCGSFRFTFAPLLKKGDGLVVQSVRMPPCHGGGRGFESRPVRKLKANEL